MAERAAVMQASRPRLTYAAANDAGSDPSQRATIVHASDAPRRLVFQKWLEPDLVGLLFASQNAGYVA
jgi:hypothetical protein